MVDFAPISRSVFAGAHQGRTGRESGAAGVVITHVPARVIVCSVATEEGALRARDFMRARFNIEAPGPRSRAAHDGVCVIWQESGRWLFVGDGFRAEEIVAQLNAAIGDHAFACDMSDGVAILSIQGGAVRHMLAKCVPLDLDPVGFGPNAAAATLMRHMDVTIWRSGTGAFTLACERSLGMDMLDALVEAGAEFGVEFTGSAQTA